MSLKSFGVAEKFTFIFLFTFTKEHCQELTFRLRNDLYTVSGGPLNSTQSNPRADKIT